MDCPRCEGKGFIPDKVILPDGTTITRDETIKLARETINNLIQRIEKLENKVTDWPEYLERKFGKEEHRALEVFGMGQSEVYAKWADRIEKLEARKCPDWNPAIVQRLDKLEDHYRHSSENLANEVLSGRIEKLEQREPHTIMSVFPNDWKDVKERLEKLEHPQMEHIKENRKNIIELAPQLLELGNHDIELRGRIENLEYENKEKVSGRFVDDLAKRIEKLEAQLKDWPLWQKEVEEQIDNIIPESERIEKLEDKMQGLMGVLEKLRDVVDKEMEEDG